MNIDSKNYEEFTNRTDFINRFIRSVPIGCYVWGKSLEDGQNFKLIDCNDECLELFGLKGKDSFFIKFKNLSPNKQPNGDDSEAKMTQIIETSFAKEDEISSIDWLHKDVFGDPLPVEISFEKFIIEDKSFLICFMKDMRFKNELLNKMRDTYECLHFILDSMPLGCAFFDDNFNCTNCNLEAVNLLGLSDKEEFIEKFFSMSPEYQPDGRQSTEKFIDYIKMAYEKRKMHFEWIHLNTKGEMIPCEIFFVRVRYGTRYLILAYANDLRELKKTIQALDKMGTIAFMDILTGLYNRRYFMDKLNSEFAAFEKPMSIIMYDLDNFKKVNDTYGHPVGDEVLRQISLRMQGLIKNGDILARYGGEEFIALIINHPSVETLAWEMQKAVAEQPLNCHGNLLSITISLGVATKTRLETTVDQLISAADEALYEAKKNGKNRVELYKGNL